MAKEIIYNGKLTNLSQDTLTDGSKVYEVGINSTRIQCTDRAAAKELFMLLEDETKIIGVS